MINRRRKRLRRLNYRFAVAFAKFKKLFEQLNKKKVAMAAGVLALMIAIPLVLPALLRPGSAEASAGAAQNEIVEKTYEFDSEDYSQPLFFNADYVANTENDDTTSEEPEDPAFVELKNGDDNEDVGKLQARLVELEYLDIDEPTSYFGTATQRAVELFQRTHDLQVDGIAGKATLELLHSEEAKVYTIYVGNIGIDIEMMQRRLAELGYFSGPVTGTYGSITEKAVRAFQKENGLFVDAKVGSQTRDILYSGDAKEAPRPKPTAKPKSNNKSGGDSTKVPNASKVEQLIAVATQQLGKRYVLGTAGTKTFDCSGLVHYSLNKVGYKIGRFNAAGYSRYSKWTNITSMSNLKRGDLLFFKTNGKAIGHTGIYIGNGMMIDASSSNGKVVKRSCTTPYWRSAFRNARRVF
ncbi:MAG: peptidoglycan-binding protein [Christensenellales bacterium]|jgi:cell wall-associated NlpC family hydrolase